MWPEAVCTQLKKAVVGNELVFQHAANGAKGCGPWKYKLQKLPQLISDVFDVSFF